MQDRGVTVPFFLWGRFRRDPVHLSVAKSEQVLYEARVEILKNAFRSFNGFLEVPR